MAQFGISITKKTSFKDSTQEFSNTYHYYYLGANPSASLAGSAIDAVVAIEKTLHSSDVTFTYARAWSSGGTVAENEMITEKPLTGTGTALTNPSMDKERAVLVQWNAGKDARNRPVKLKKWFHCCGNFAGVTFAASILQNSGSISVANRTSIENAVAGLNPLMVNTSPMYLVAESGRESEPTPQAHKFLEHHQLGDQWRG